MFTSHRPDIDPKFATALREAEAQAKAQAEALEFQQKQMELQVRRHILFLVFFRSNVS